MEKNVNEKDLIVSKGGYGLGSLFYGRQEVLWGIQVLQLS